MKAKVIFDKIAKDNNLFSGWGLSFLVEEKILFDTGENGEWLLKNLKAQGADLKKIEAVVISHDHWDHWGGLWDILKIRKWLKVYILPGFSREFKDKAQLSKGRLIEAQGFTMIGQDIYITGEIPGAYHGKYMPEQALVLKSRNGITVITGCAHPGILKILGKVKAKFPGEDIYAVLGGFHLKESDKSAVEKVVKKFKELGVVKAGPTHCSGEAAEEEFRKEYQDNFMEIYVGKELEV